MKRFQGRKYLNQERKLDKAENNPAGQVDSLHKESN